MVAIRFPIKALEGLRHIGSAGWLVYLFGKACLLVAVFLSYEVGNLLFSMQNEAKELGVLAANAAVPPEQRDSRPQIGFDAYTAIAQRNIFGSKPKDTSVRNDPNPQAKSKFRLVGTERAPGKSPFAIIEDTTKQIQDVFDLNEMVFNQAKLVDIQRESVKVDYSGRLETLFLDDGAKNPSQNSPDSSDQGPDGTDFTISESDLTQEMADLPRLLSQARAVPFFKNGVSIGMRIFAIRQGSLYEKLGLKNGDIIKGINDNAIADPSQAIKLFEQLKSEKQIAVKLERNGEDTNLNYQIR